MDAASGVVHAAARCGSPRPIAWCSAGGGGPAAGNAASAADGVAVVAALCLGFLD